MGGIIILVGAICLFLLVIVKAEFSLMRLIWDAMSILLGAIICGVPGAYLYIGASVMGATGKISWVLHRPPLPTIVLIAGILFGSLAGLFITERLREHITLAFLPILGSVVGFGVSYGICFLGILYSQNTNKEIIALILCGVCVIIGVIAGYAIFRNSVLP